MHSQTVPKQSYLFRPSGRAMQPNWALALLITIHGEDQVSFVTSTDFLVFCVGFLVHWWHIMIFFRFSSNTKSELMHPEHLCRRRFLAILQRGCSICSHTLAGSETPDSVSLTKVVFLVVFLVQFGHVLGDHVLIQLIWEAIRRRQRLEEATVLCAPRPPFHDPDRCNTQETV